MNRIDRLSFNWLAHQINNDVFERVRPFVRGRVVDLGCGTAQYRDDILTQADDYIGIDWPSSFHDVSQAKVFASLSACLPLCGATADTVTCFQVMEHVPETNVLLAEGFRILREGGCMIVTVPFMWHVHEAPHDYYRFTSHGLAHLFAKHGFTDVRIEATTGFWQTWILKLNYHTARWVRGPARALFIPFWFVGQALAPWLDRHDPHREETCGYLAVARKPPAGAAAAVL